MEGSGRLGSKGLIKKHEFVRVMIQGLYSIGCGRAASCLELESGIACQSDCFRALEAKILSGDWEGCINMLNGVKDVSDETRADALFLVLRQSLMEYSKCGNEKLALEILQKEAPLIRVSRDRIHNLAYGIVFTKGMEGSEVDNDDVYKRRKLVRELGKLLPPPISIPERRLEHLVETAVLPQIDSCMYHNLSGPVSVYADHLCGRDQIPTETVQILTEHKNEVWFVQFSHNGEYLASSSSDCTAIIWKVQEDDSLTLRHTLRSHVNPVSFVAWSPDDTKLLTCGNGEVLKLWDVETGTCKHTFGDHGFIVSSCAWFPDSKRLVCGSVDPEKGISMWDCDGNELKAWRGMRMPKILDLAVTPDGQHLISIFSDKEIRILNVGTHAERVISEDHAVTSLSISRDSKFFIVNLNSQEIHMWDVAGKMEKPLKYMGHMQSKYVIRSCFGGSNSLFISSGSENAQVYIWNWRNWKPIEVLCGHTMTVNSVSWNLKRPQMLASASDDQTIRIWGSSLSKKTQPKKLS